MATSSNILCLSGISSCQSTGSVGAIGPVGAIGLRGSTGPIGYVGNMYDLVMERYEVQGFNMMYETETGIEIKIKDLDDIIIKNCISIIKMDIKTEVGRAWLDIFADVTVKRRKIKLDKIKSKMICVK